MKLPALFLILLLVMPSAKAQEENVVSRLCGQDDVKRYGYGLERCGKYFISIPGKETVDAGISVYDVKGELLGRSCGGMPRYHPDGTRTPEETYCAQVFKCVEQGAEDYPPRANDLCRSP